MKSFKARNYFKPFHERVQQKACIVAHRRAGKSVACVVELVKRAQNDQIKRARYAYIAPFYKQGKEIAWAYLQAIARRWATKINQSELKVTLKNGNTIKIYGADNPDALRGLRFDGVICDEFGDWKAGAFHSVILPTLIDRNGWFVIIGTAKGHNDFYTMYKLASANPDEWYVDNLAASKTKILDEKLLADARAMMSEDQYEREFENNFEASIPGAYYGELMSNALKEGRIREVLPIAGYPISTAWDLGRSDSTSIIFYQQVGAQIHVIDYYENHGKNVDHYANIVLLKGYNYHKHYLPHDSRTKTLAANYSVIEQLAQIFGMHQLYVLPIHHLQDGIQATRNLFPRCWFDEKKCDRLLEALRAYQREWDDEKKCFKETPLHDWASHPSDAMRYMAQSINLQYANDPKKKEFDWANPPQPTFAQIIEQHERSRSKHTRI